MIDEYDASGKHPKLQALPVCDPLAPWTPFVRRDEYLLTHFAFADNCTHCQVVSNNGISVLSIPSLDLVHNEPEHGLSIEFPKLIMDGVGPLAGQRLRFAGRDGGGFSYRSSDGWRCEPMFMRNSLEAVFLQPPESEPESIADVLNYEYNKVVEGKPMIAVGFCLCGDHIVIANSDILYLASRLPRA